MFLTQKIRPFITASTNYKLTKTMQQTNIKIQSNICQSHKNLKVREINRVNATLEPW